MTPSHVPHAAQPLTGRVAVVTGAGGGLGAVIAAHLAALGAQVVVLDLELARVEDLASRLQETGTQALPLACDVADEAGVARATNATLEAFGRCDVLVNNAGILAPPSPLDSLTVEEWDRTFAVNARGAFVCTREFGRPMCAHGSGSIVNIASIAAGAPNASPPYSASKAAVLALTRHTAVEWGPRGVRANAVSPGFVRTPLSEAQYAQGDLLAMRERMVPLRRIGQPQEIASVVGFLAGDGCAFVTGQEIVVDGGFTQTPLMHAQVPAVQYGGVAA